MVRIRLLLLCGGDCVDVGVRHNHVDNTNAQKPARSVQNGDEPRNGGGRAGRRQIGNDRHQILSTW